MYKKNAFTNITKKKKFKKKLIIKNFKKNKKYIYNVNIQPKLIQYFIFPIKGCFKLITTQFTHCGQILSPL